MSKKEKAILFTATIEKVTLTKYFIQELASKYTTEQVQNFIIETAKAKKVQEIEQDGAYIRGIIKKQGLVKSTKKKIEKKNLFKRKTNKRRLCKAALERKILSTVSP